MISIIGIILYLIGLMSDKDEKHYIDNLKGVNCIVYIEVYNKNIKKYGSFENAVANGYCIKWTEEKVKKAFCFGHGTFDHFKEYMERNKSFCTYKEVHQLQLIA